MVPRSTAPLPPKETPNSLWVLWGVELLAFLLERLLTPAACLLWIVLLAPHDFFAAVLAWISGIQPLPLLQILVSWPAVALVIVLIIGPQSIRDFALRIEAIGDFKRKIGDAAPESVGPPPSDPAREDR